MAVNQKAAAAWHMIHERKLTMEATAKALSIRTLDVSDLRIAHKKLLDAKATARATRAGVAAAEPLADVAAIELAHRERVFGTTLMHLIETAQVNIISANGQKPVLSDQYTALRSAARDLQIDDGLALSEFLCTYPPALPAFIAKIEDASSARSANCSRSRCLSWTYSIFPRRTNSGLRGDRHFRRARGT
jgi:hypothetical protein